MDRTIAKPDVFLAHYLSLMADDDIEERRIATSTTLALTLLLIVSGLACAVAAGLLS